MNILNILNNLGTGGTEAVLMDVIRGTYQEVNHSILVKSPQNIYDDELNNMSVEVIYAPSVTKTNFIKHINFMNQFFEENHFKIDIIHFYCGSLNYSLPISLAKKYNIPIIIHSHSSRSSSNKIIPNTIHKLNRIKYKGYDNTYNIACSSAAGDWMFGNEQYRIIYNGINLNLFKFRNGNHFNPDRITIGHIGSFLPVKNQKYLIDLILYLEQNQPEKFELVLIGDGPDINRVKEYVKEKQLDKIVTFLGFKRNVEDYYSSIDIIIFPSIFEGLPLVLIEAQAIGIPVLASDVVDTEIKQAENFDFFSLNDSLPLVEEKINRLIKIGVKKQDNLKDTVFDLNVMVNEIMEMYNIIYKKNNISNV